jgi:uracil-DNA glycosylase family 4
MQQMPDWAEFSSLLRWMDACGVTHLLSDTAPDHTTGDHRLTEKHVLQAKGQAFPEPGAKAPGVISPLTDALQAKGKQAQQLQKKPDQRGKALPGLSQNMSGSVSGNVSMTMSDTFQNDHQTALHKAADATSLEELRQALAAFEGCKLKKSARNLVFGDGNPQARIMFVGEAPGRDEDREGLPFVGRAGKLLDKMLAAIGLHSRDDYYISNILPWRPPGNRTPTIEEVELCRPFIERHITLVDPDILIFLGGSAAKGLLQSKEGITKLRGRWLDYHTGKRTIAALATFHPAYLLRNPIQKRLVWNDLLMVQDRLKAD